VKIPGARRVEVHGVIPSTNLRARELAAQGAPPFTVVVADGQSRGRGRSGRKWHSPPGAGLWMSVVLSAPADGPHGRVSILLGIAAAEAVEAVAGVEVGLKWPNDVLLRSSRPSDRVPLAGGDPWAGEDWAGKVAGILCEVAPTPGGEALLVAGFGVNLRTFGSGVRPPGALGLEEGVGRPVDREALAVALIRGLRRWADPPPAGALSPAALSEWARRDALFGHEVLTSTGDEGIACGVDPSGALRVEVPGRRMLSVTSGSVRRRGEGSSALFLGSPARGR